MVSGTLVLRFKPHYGWQVFDWIPASFTIDKPAIKIIRDANDKASLIRIKANFSSKLRIRQFCRAPHKLMCFSHPSEQRLAA